jgi:putative membrane protein
MLWIKAFHIISMVAWMAGMLYLPRLYVYHAQVAPGSEASETFKVMERRLLRAIINPAMIATFVFGIWLAWLQGPAVWHTGWFQLKLLLVVVLTGLHGLFSRWRRDFAADRNTRPARFYRIMNEVPTAILIAAVILAVVKPW